MNNDQQWERFWNRVRNVVLLAGGLAGFWYEILFEQADRPWIIAGCMGMMGLGGAKWLEGVLGRSQVPPPPPQNSEQQQIEEHSS